jgi:phosphoribosylglycinamide formyltransferase-1
MNIVVLVSGSGTNLQALIDARQSFGESRIAAVISDKAGAFALERAKRAGIPALTELPDRGLAKEERRLDLSNRILALAKQYEAGLIVLAGFLSILKGPIVTEKPPAGYAGRIINLHPALLPKYGGEGMYGGHVHEAVLAAGEKESGCTVHLVDAGTDTGPVLIQRKVSVLPGDTGETLAERIHTEEHIAIVEAVRIMLTRMENL